MSETEPTANHTPTETKKPSKLGKMIGWGFVIGFAIFMANVKGAKKDVWCEEQHQLAVSWCNGDAKCLSVVQDHWKHCVDENHESQRQGKYNRKYTLDEAGFRGCLSHSGADHLAQK